MPEKDLTDGVAQVNITTSKRGGNVKREWIVKRNKNEKKDLPSKKQKAICNIVLAKEALVSDFSFKTETKGCAKFMSLIDTGASMSIMSYEAWRKIGKPRITPCPVMSILLGDNGEVPVEGITSIKVHIDN